MQNKDELTSQAAQYAPMGWSVLPAQGKRPAVTEWKIHQQRLPTDAELEEWCSKEDVTGIGLVTGQLSGVIVIDAEKEGLKELYSKNIPKTVRSKTGGGGEHVYLRHPGFPIKNSAKKIGEAIDIRGDGGFVVLPPSKHASGNRYEWINSPLDTEVADCPKEILDWIQTDKSHDSANTTVVGNDYIMEGKRNSELHRIASLWRRLGMSEKAIEEDLLQFNNSRCRPSLEIEEVKAIAKSAAQYQPHKTQSSKEGSLVISNMYDLEEKEQKWAWNKYIPQNVVSIMEGDPETKKSFLCLKIGSDISQERLLPGNEFPVNPKKTLLLLAEDGLETTVKKRLRILDADQKQFYAITAVKYGDGTERFFSLESDIEKLKCHLSSHEYALLIIDPINAYLPNLDTNNDAKVRRVMTPLKQIAEEYNIAIICIRHLTKTKKDRSIQQGQGSMGFFAAARAVLLVGKNPSNPEESVVISHKHSNSETTPASLAFCIQNNKFEWRGEVDITADDLLAPVDNKSNVSQFNNAKKFLLDLLKNGPIAATEVSDKAGIMGIKERTLNRAKKDLKIESGRFMQDKRKSAWKLPSTQENWQTSSFLATESQEHEDCQEDPWQGSENGSDKGKEDNIANIPCQGDQGRPDYMVDF